MSREGALLVMIAVAVALLVLLAWAWRRRQRRDRVTLVAAGELPETAVVLAAFDGLYVATTRHDEPLERIAAPGWGFRSRVGITVAREGLALDLTGRPRVVLTPDRLVEVGQSTVAIDRVVEKDGLTRIAWRTDAGEVVDTYLRPQDASARALADAIRPLIAPTRTGSAE